MLYRPFGLQTHLFTLAKFPPPRWVVAALSDGREARTLVSIYPVDSLVKGFSVVIKGSRLCFPSPTGVKVHPDRVSRVVSRPQRDIRN